MRGTIQSLGLLCFVALGVLSGGPGCGSKAEPAPGTTTTTGTGGSCVAVGAACTVEGVVNPCCKGACSDPDGGVCCNGPADPCASTKDCCASWSSSTLACQSGHCCLPIAASCNGAADCCSGACNGVCCSPAGGTCAATFDCCPGHTCTMGKCT